LARGVRIILQPFVEGSGYGVSGVFSKGSPIALLAHRRIREKQPTGGPSALAETITLDDRLCLPANRIMRAVGWNGPAMVEFKGDLEGRLNLMEVNARFWGSLPLAEAAGIDFPRIYLDQLKLGPLRAHRRSYRVGIQGRYLLGDTLHLFRVLRGGKTHWPGRLPGRARALASYVKACLSGRVVHLDLIRGDFRPFFARIVSFLVERKGT
jgi:predicted ATP-grasp superfamily ATP-dependent carboligase